MGWSFRKGATKADIIAEITQEQPRHPAFQWSNAEQKSVPTGYDLSAKTLRKCVRGNVLWTVEEIVRYKDPVERDTFIGCYLLETCRGDFGYKPMEEAMGPYYFSCPLSYLDMVPETNRSWRETVRKYHAEKTQQNSPPRPMPAETQAAKPAAPTTNTPEAVRPIVERYHPKLDRNEAMNEYEKNYELLHELLPEGREHIRIENNPFVPLVVERIWDNQISLCRYAGLKEGPMRAPEQLIFHVSDAQARPVYFRNDYAHREQYTWGTDKPGPQLKKKQRELDSVTHVWWERIKEQGFFEAAKELHKANDQDQKHEITRER